MSNYLNLVPRVVLGAALAGIVGAAGVYIYEQVYAEQRRAMLISKVGKLDKKVALMRAELEALRELQTEMDCHRQKVRSKLRPKREKKAALSPSGDAVDAPQRAGGAGVSYASDSEYFTDYQSVLGTDGEMDSEEFYDVHTDDDDDNTLKEDSDDGRVQTPDQELKLDSLRFESSKKNET